MLCLTFLTLLLEGEQGDRATFVTSQRVDSQNTDYLESIFFPGEKEEKVTDGLTLIEPLLTSSCFSASHCHIISIKAAFVFSSGGLHQPTLLLPLLS